MAKTAIPVALDDFDGTLESTRGLHNDENIIAPHFSSGNKCNHNKLHPDIYQTPSHQKTRPYIIEKAKKALEKFYFRPQKFLSELNKRSERREAIMRVLQCVLDYTDLITLKVKSITINFLTKHTSLGYKRILRALKDLKRAGYIFIQRVYKRISNDDFIGLASVKTINMQLFYKLGIKQKEIAKYRRKKEIEGQELLIEKESLKARDAFMASLIKPIEAVSNKSAAKFITEHISTLKNLLMVKV